MVVILVTMFLLSCVTRRVEPHQQKPSPPPPPPPRPTARRTHIRPPSIHPSIFQHIQITRRNRQALYIYLTRHAITTEEENKKRKCVSISKTPIHILYSSSFLPPYIYSFFFFFFSLLPFTLVPISIQIHL